MLDGGAVEALEGLGKHVTANKTLMKQPAVLAWTPPGEFGKIHWPKVRYIDVDPNQSLITVLTAFSLSSFLFYYSVTCVV